MHFADDEWLIVAIWGASDWMLADDRLITDHFADQHRRQRAWIYMDDDYSMIDELSPRAIGRLITSLQVRRNRLEMGLDSGMRIVIDETPERRPNLEGNGQSRAFSEHDDLRDLVFLLPTADLKI